MQCTSCRRGSYPMVGATYINIFRQQLIGDLVLLENIVVYRRSCKCRPKQESKESSRWRMSVIVDVPNCAGCCIAQGVLGLCLELLEDSLPSSKSSHWLLYGGSGNLLQSSARCLEGSGGHGSSSDCSRSGGESRDEETRCHSCVAEVKGLREWMREVQDRR